MGTDSRVARSLALLLTIVASLQLQQVRARPEDADVAIQIERRAPQAELTRAARAIQSPDALHFTLSLQQQPLPSQLVDSTGEASGSEWQLRKVRSPNPVADDDYEEVEEGEDGPEGRHLHGIKRKIKRKLKHKLHHGLGAPGLLGGWQQPGYGPVAIANPGYGGYHGPIGGGGGWRPPHQHYHHHHQFGHGGGNFGGFGNGGGWNPGYGGGGWRPGGPAPGASAQSWSFGPFQAAFAQSG